MSDVRKKLAAAAGRREAVAMLEGLSKKELLAIGRELQVAVTSGDTVAQMRRRIVDATAGVREDAAAIRDNWR